MRARTSSPLTNRAGRQTPSSLHSRLRPLVGMSSMKRSSTASCRAKRTKSRISSSLTPRMTTVLILIGAEPGRPGGLEAGEDAVEARPPRDGLEAVPAERIEADGDPHEPGRLEVRPRTRPGAGRWSSGPGRRARARPGGRRARRRRAAPAARRPSAGSAGRPRPWPRGRPRRSPRSSACPPWGREARRPRACSRCSGGRSGP